MTQENTNKTSAAGMPVRAQRGKYLTFRLGQEEYGLEILKVQEIIGLMSITRVPKLPHYVRGIINLRGRLIPVIEIRKKFELPDQEDTPKSCIIVVQVRSGDGMITMGILVDSVSEVRNVEEIDPAPDLGDQTDTEFMLGMGKVGDKVVILLDVDQVLTGGEADAISAMLKSSQKSAA